MENINTTIPKEGQLPIENYYFSDRRKKGQDPNDLDGSFLYHSDREKNDIEIGQRLGKGLFTNVFAAKIGDAEVVIKISTYDVDEPKAKKIFGTEANLLKKLNIAQEKANKDYFPNLFGDGLISFRDGERIRYALLMEHVKYPKMVDIALDEVLSEERILEIYYQYADMLILLHTCGITVSDRKIGDLFVDPETNKLKVLDWNVVNEDSDAYILDWWKMGEFLYQSVFQSRIFETRVNPDESDKKSFSELGVPLGEHESWQNLSHELQEIMYLFFPEGKNLQAEVIKETLIRDKFWNALQTERMRDINEKTAREEKRRSLLQVEKEEQKKVDQERLRFVQKEEQKKKDLYGGEEGYNIVEDLFYVLSDLKYGWEDKAGQKLEEIWKKYSEYNENTLVLLKLERAKLAVDQSKRILEMGWWKSLTDEETRKTRTLVTEIRESLFGLEEIIPERLSDLREIFKEKFQAITTLVDQKMGEQIELSFEPLLAEFYYRLNLYKADLFREQRKYNDAALSMNDAIESLEKCPYREILKIETPKIALLNKVKQILERKELSLRVTELIENKNKELTSIADTFKIVGLSPWFKNYLETAPTKIIEDVENLMVKLDTGLDCIESGQLESLKEVASLYKNILLIFLNRTITEDWGNYFYSFNNEEKKSVLTDTRKLKILNPGNRFSEAILIKYCNWLGYLMFYDKPRYNKERIIFLEFFPEHNSAFTEVPIPTSRGEQNRTAVA